MMHSRHGHHHSLARAVRPLMQVNHLLLGRAGQLREMVGDLRTALDEELRLNFGDDNKISGTVEPEGTGGISAGSWGCSLTWVLCVQGEKAAVLDSGNELAGRPVGGVP